MWHLLLGLLTWFWPPSPVQVTIEGAMLDDVDELDPALLVDAVRDAAESGRLYHG